VLFFFVVASLHNGPRLRMRDWKRTDSVETEKFLGLLLMMDILKKPLIAQYWSKNSLNTTPLFSSVMSRNRFQLLLSMLHFNDNTQQLSRDDPLQDKLFKLRPVVDHLFEYFQVTYSMSKDVCIDESLLLWKGRLPFKQYIPIKRSRFGVKLFKLYDSNIFIASEFMLAKTTCFNFRQAYHNH